MSDKHAGFVKGEYIIKNSKMPINLLDEINKKEEEN